MNLLNIYFNKLCLLSNEKMKKKNEKNKAKWNINNECQPTIKKKKILENGSRQNSCLKEKSKIVHNP